MKWKNGKKKTRILIMTTSSLKERFKMFITSFDRRLRRYEWMHQKFHIEHKTVAEIADIIGCSPETVRKHLQKHDLLGSDKIFDVYTGRFHGLGKRAIMWIVKRNIKTINKVVDEIYDRTTSRNALIFKDIIESMEKLDLDQGISSGKQVDLTRKELYILGCKFFICLYDFDSYYDERGSYILKRILDRKDDFFIDELADPKNWYPNRPHDAWSKHLFARCTKHGEQMFFINASETTIKHENQTERWFNSIKKKKQTP
ncbi:MAG: hypothetical protein OCU18_08520 [Candidatus Syntrophoarchaeum sp.]|nr:hypothetical protein [Candidatus Syntrophoarchaeum sp.]